MATTKTIRDVMERLLPLLRSKETAPDSVELTSESMLRAVYPIIGASPAELELRFFMNSVFRSYQPDLRKKAVLAKALPPRVEFNSGVARFRLSDVQTNLESARADLALEEARVRIRSEAKCACFQIHGSRKAEGWTWTKELSVALTSQEIPHLWSTFLDWALCYAVGKGVKALYPKGAANILFFIEQLAGACFLAYEEVVRFYPHTFITSPEGMEHIAQVICARFPNLPAWCALVLAGAPKRFGDICYQCGRSVQSACSVGGKHCACAPCSKAGCVPPAAYTIRLAAAIEVALLFVCQPVSASDETPWLGRLQAFGCGLKGCTLPCKKLESPLVVDTRPFRQALAAESGKRQAELKCCIHTLQEWLTYSREVVTGTLAAQRDVVGTKGQVALDSLLELFRSKWHLSESQIEDWEDMPETEKWNGTRFASTFDPYAAREPVPLNAQPGLILHYASSKTIPEKFFKPLAAHWFEHPRLKTLSGFAWYAPVRAWDTDKMVPKPLDKEAERLLVEWQSRQVRQGGQGSPRDKNFPKEAIAWLWLLVSHNREHPTSQISIPKKIKVNTYGRQQGRESKGREDALVDLKKKIDKLEKQLKEKSSAVASSAASSSGDEPEEDEQLEDKRPPRSLSDVMFDDEGNEWYEWRERDTEEFSFTHPGVPELRLKETRLLWDEGLGCWCVYVQRTKVSYSSKMSLVASRPLKPAKAPSPPLGVAGPSGTQPKGSALDKARSTAKSLPNKSSPAPPPAPCVHLVRQNGVCLQCGDGKKPSGKKAVVGPPAPVEDHSTTPSGKGKNKEQAPPASSPGRQVHCDNCNRDFVSAKAFESHSAGLAHLKKVFQQSQYCGFSHVGLDADMCPVCGTGKKEATSPKKKGDVLAKTNPLGLTEKKSKSETGRVLSETEIEKLRAHFGRSSPPPLPDLLAMDKSARKTISKESRLPAWALAAVRADKKNLSRILDGTLDARAWHASQAREKSPSTISIGDATQKWTQVRRKYKGTPLLVTPRTAKEKSFRKEYDSLIEQYGRLDCFPKLGTNPETRGRSSKQSSPGGSRSSSAGSFTDQLRDFAEIAKIFGEVSKAFK